MNLKDSKYDTKIIPKILVMNKIDLCVNKRKLNWSKTELEDLGKFDKIFYVSCETGYGI